MMLIPVYALFSYGAFRVLGKVPKYTHHLCFWGALWLISFIVTLSYQPL